MHTLKLDENQFNSLVDTINRVIVGDRDIALSSDEDTEDAIELDAKFAYEKAISLKQLIQTVQVANQREFLQDEKYLFSRLLQTAFVNELNEEFNEFPLQEGTMVFFIDKFTEELTEIRCLKPEGLAGTRNGDIVKVPMDKERILVMNEAIW